QVSTTMVLASLPKSGMEVGGPRGKEVLEELKHLFSRIESIWKPVAAEEGFEIVRRRLFNPLTDAVARDEVCNAFVSYYEGQKNFPAVVMEGGYLQRLKTAYPFHPEIFDRLYEDWATHENFQRTRGVLRLMAMIIHRLWIDGNKDYMIMPGALPLHDAQIRNELLRYLPQGWEPVVERDVDGERAMPTEIDRKETRFGSIQAARRVARTVFLGSAPSTSSQNIRGINIENIRLGSAQPGQAPGTFNDALRRLADQLHYLYSGKDRYWYDTQTNLRREAEDRISRFEKKEHLIPEIRKHLLPLYKGRPFRGVHIFTSHEDIPDDTYLRLVILSPDSPHKWKNPSSPAIDIADKIRENRGDQPRVNQNRLLFLAADGNAAETVYDITRRYLAWESILDDKEMLNLDEYHKKEAREKKEDHIATLKDFLMEAYKWLLAPYQESASSGGMSSIKWEEQRVPNADGDPMRAIIPVLTENEIVISNWDPFHLKTQLDTWYWKDSRVDYPIKTLWSDFCRYTYLP
ncbi:MAG: ATP-binding protein, partial [bacterium]|nr:ATP-binding protein [bacterium]